MNKLKQSFSWLKAKTVQFWTWYKNLYIGRPWYVKTVAGFCTMIVFFFLYLGAVDVNLFWLFGKSPGWLEVSEHKTSEASELYSADGVLLGKYFNENRTPVEYGDVNPVFWRALIDTEDERFYDHWGVDPIGLFGAVKDAATGKGGRGASTLTQQLAKNMFRTRSSQYSTGLLGSIPGVKMLIMKTKEWIIATKLELYFATTKGRHDGKNEILVQYANTVDFGNNAFGIKTAAKTYFNANPKDLTADQCAILVGMLKATTYYNPISHPENCLKRRNQVLDNMRTHGDLTSDLYKEFSEKPIDVSEFKVEENYDGKAMYFREYLTKYIRENVDSTIDLYNDGLKIYTTIDSRMQEYAEQAVRKQMRQVQRNFKNHWGSTHPWQDENHNEIPGFIEKIARQQSCYKVLQAKYPNDPDSIEFYLNKPHKVKLFDYDEGEIEKEMSTMDSIRYMVSFMHCSFMAMEPQSGQVKAWVGDIDFKHWKYDKVTAQRQPGSTFKLFVYTEAMEQGLTPCDKRRDEYFSMQVWDKQKKKEVTWAPTNANGYFTGDSMPLKAAFAQSINSVAVRLGQEMGIKYIVETAKAMGITSPLDETPSLALGSSDVTLLELANAYSTIANEGKAHPSPVLITKIVDRDGNEIYVAPSEEKQAISLRSSYLMQQMLQGGLKEAGGTSQPLWGYVGDFRDTEFGGKTGTSNNHSDAWFMGVSPKLVCGAWVGGEYRCIHFRTGALGQGSRTALPICGYFLEAVFKDPAFKKYHAKFEKPDGVDVDLSMYACSYTRSRRDTLNADSLNFEDEVMLDENGNPVPHENNGGTDKSATEQSKEQEVKLEDL